MIKNTYICETCTSIFESFCDEEIICPHCHSVNGFRDLSVEQAKSEMANFRNRAKAPVKNYFVYYYTHGLFRVMHKDSHFYTHSECDISTFSRSDSQVRLYSIDKVQSAIKAIKERHPNWELNYKKI